MLNVGMIGKRYEGNRALMPRHMRTVAVYLKACRSCRLIDFKGLFLADFFKCGEKIAKF